MKTAKCYEKRAWWKGGKPTWRQVGGTLPKGRPPGRFALRIVSGRKQIKRGH